MSAPTRQTLAVMTRYPSPGTVKTRLIPALGGEGAADLQRAMTAHTLRHARALRARTGTRVDVWFEGGSLEDMQRTFGRDLSYRRQREGGLGERIREALSCALREGAERAIVIGSDCPSLDGAALAEAFCVLGAFPAVVGPADDGGYYLLGMQADAARVALEPVTRDIPWGTSDVFRATGAAFASAGVHAALLDPRRDVDTEADLPDWNAVSAPPTTLSVIIAALNEEEAIAAALAQAAAPGIELIVADGDSADGTREIARAAGARVLDSPRGRARQLNDAADVASGDALLFLHADTLLPDGYAAEVLRILSDPDVALGAFTFATDWDTPLMRMLARGTNERARKGMPYGDQALFCRASTFRALGGFPDLPVMEDAEFVRRAGAVGRIALSEMTAVTSARAWRAHGPLRWTAINRMTALRFRLGADPARLATWRAAQSKR